MDRFVRHWQAAEDVWQVCQAFRISPQTASRLAAKARAAGHPLKKLPMKKRFAAGQVISLIRATTAARHFIRAWTTCRTIDGVGRALNWPPARVLRGIADLRTIGVHLLPVPGNVGRR